MAGPGCGWEAGPAGHASDEGSRAIESAFPDHHVASALEVDVSGSGGPTRLTLLHLGWRREDPLAVDLSLRTVPPHPTLPRGEWAMLRDFLRYGLDEPTGDGQVWLGPGPTGQVAMVLGDRHYRVLAPREALQEFLDRTEALVPTGAEADDTALDLLVARLLGS